MSLPRLEDLEPRLLLTAQVPAFPGAEGYGMFTAGGRGGDVYEVTTLSDSGPGSLRDAVSQPNRTVVFRVSGNIELQSTLFLNQPNITIAGQTAPGDGITLKNYALRVNTHNVIIRYLRVRPGDLGSDNQVDGISMGSAGGYDLMFDHLSVSWAIDEDFSIYGLPNVTIQWSIISEALHDSKHPSGDHSMGGIQNGRDMTVHHSIFISNNDRNPKFNIADWWPGQNTDFRNNVIYNWGDRSTWGGNGGSTLTNMVNNYYKAGPASSNPSRLLSMEAGNPGEWYISGNYVYGYPSVTADNWTGVADASRGIRVDQPFSYAPVTTQSAQDAYALVLQYAGCTVPLRDSVDTRVLNDVVNGTGTIIDSQTDVGGWPVLNSTTPPSDSDHDGMPDSWEMACGLNPNDAADRNGDYTGDGYTNLEKYLNGLVPTLGSISGPVLPSQAFWPFPASAATQEDANPQLKWKAGFNTVSQRVYFGTSPTLTEADFKEEKVFTQQVINKQLITTSVYEPGALQLGTTYYWRVDSVNANGVTTGQTWSFTPGLPVAGPGSGNRMEAENMTLRRAFVEGGDGTYWAAVPSETGTMRYAFDKAGGIYSISVRYIDEGDGAGLFSVYVNSDLVGQWTADVNNDQFVTRSLGDVQINPGDVIKVVSNRHQDELGRVDYVDTVFQGTDTTPPASSVAALPPEVVGPFEVSWSGSDDGTWVSGLADCDIYVSDDGGPFALWLDHTTATSATYTGLAGHSYAFYSRARDKAGNVEAAPATPDAQTSVGFAQVAGRWVFYNHSALDGNDPAANANDDAAIATDKYALLPGNMSSGANFTSYGRGLNGLMVDILDLANPSGLTLATIGDYVTFKGGNDDDPESWASAPVPAEVSLRPGAGAGDSTRVTIIWTDGAIQGQWLQVTVLANESTGLADEDVFYFGNLPGDTNSDGDTDFGDYQILEAGFGAPGSIAEGDFDVDGLVEFDDYQILEGNFGGGLATLSPPRPLNGTFVRDSVAYDVNGAELAVDEAEWGEVAVANPPDPVSLAGAGPYGENLTPWCVRESGGVRYMMYSRTMTSGMPRYIYQQAEGSGTIVRMNNTVTNIYGIISLAGGTILIFVSQYVYRSTDGGVTADRGTGQFIAANAALTLLTGQNAVPWGHHQAADTGTVLMWPYGGSSSESYQLYRSADDGGTWTLVYTVTGDKPAGNRHYHSAIKHAATGRWIVTRGDAANDRILYSDDDGLTWADLVPRGLWRWRPIGLWDYGHPTRILAGSDSNGQVQWFDVLSLERGNLLTDLDQRSVAGVNGKGIVLDLYEYGGVYYAPTSDDSGSDQNSTLRISSDLVHWCSYYRFASGTPRHYVAGYFNGRIYLRSTSGSWYSATGVSVALPTLVTSPVIHISQGVTNLLANADDSSFEASVGSWGKPTGGSSTYSVIWSTERAWHGTGSMKVTWGPGVSPIGVRTVEYPSGSGYYPVSEGERYRATLRLRGTIKRSITAYWGFNATPTQVTTNAPYVEVDDLGWTEIRLAEVTVGSGQTGMKIILSGDGDSEQVLYVDGCQLERLDAGPQAPAVWQLGGTPRADAILSEETHLASAWTLMGTFVPEYDRWQFDTIGSGSYLHLVSIVVGNSTVELFSDPGNADKFNMTVTDGVTSETERTSAQYFYRGGPIQWAIRSDSEGHLSLSIANGGAVEHTSVTFNAFPGLLDADGYVCAGDSEGGHLLPGWITEPRVFGFRMTDAEIVEEMNNVGGSQTLVCTTVSPAALQAAVSPQSTSRGQGTDPQDGLVLTQAKASQSVSHAGRVAPSQEVSLAAPLGAGLEAPRPVPQAGAEIESPGPWSHRRRLEPAECRVGDSRQATGDHSRGNHWRWPWEVEQDALADDGLRVDLLAGPGRRRRPT